MCVPLNASSVAAVAHRGEFRPTAAAKRQYAAPGVYRCTILIEDRELTTNKDGSVGANTQLDRDWRRRGSDVSHVNTVRVDQRVDDAHAGRATIYPTTADRRSAP